MSSVPQHKNDENDENADNQYISRLGFLGETKTKIQWCLKEISVDLQHICIKSREKL